MKTPEEECRGGGHVMMEAEIGVIWPQANGALEPPGAGRGGDTAEGVWPWDLFWPPDRGKYIPLF